VKEEGQMTPDEWMQSYRRQQLSGAHGASDARAWKYVATAFFFGLALGFTMASLTGHRARGSCVNLDAQRAPRVASAARKVTARG
jgi:hypothetical protein